MRPLLLPLVVLAGCVHPPEPSKLGCLDTCYLRADLGHKLRGELEVSWLSDRNVLEEFFDKEFEAGKTR